MTSEYRNATVEQGPGDEPGPVLRVSTLGGLKLQGRRGPAVPYEGRYHVKALLALAACASGGISRDEIVELLWPKAGETAARNRLYHTVHLARQVLSALAWDDEWVTVRNSRVALDKRIWSDVQQLHEAAQVALAHQHDTDAGLKGDALQASLALCHDTWMPGLDLGAAGAAIRARVRDQQAAVLRAGVVANRSHGDTPAQRELLARLLRTAAPDEWAYRELMTLDLAAGRRHAVLRTFEQASRELIQRLGLRPGPATCAIAAQATAELQQGPAAEPESGLSATRLVGREALIQDLVAQMAAQGGIWNLTGPSGVGKTAVCREVARRLAPTMADGVHAIRLGDLAAHETGAAACARAIGLVPVPGRDDGEQLAQALRRRPGVWILDDLDAATDGPELLARLAEVLQSPSTPCPARIIVTSRSRMSDQLRHVVVAPLELPELHGGPAAAMQSASMVLFQLRCPTADPDRQSDGWQRDAIRLLQRLDGLPLAIELAAARTITMTPGEILGQIEQTLGPLSDGTVELQGRHRSVQASLDWSVALLSAQARAAYEAAAVFPGRFALHDVARLMPVMHAGPSASLGDRRAGADDLESTRSALEELADAGLIVRTEDSQALRMLHLPRAHAQTAARRDGRWAALLDARLRELCASVQRLPLNHESPEYARNQRRLMALEDDAVALLDHARKTDPVRFVELLAPLCECWTNRGIVNPVLRWGEVGAEHAIQQGAWDAAALLLLCVSRCCRGSGRADWADSACDTLTGLLHRVSDPVLHSRAVIAQFIRLCRSGNRPAAEELLRQAHETRRAAQDQGGYWTLLARCCMEGLHQLVELPDLHALRSRLLGSCVWPTLLYGILWTRAAEHLPWEDKLGLTEEVIATANELMNLGLVHGALKRRGYFLLQLDEPAQAVACFERSSNTSEGQSETAFLPRLDSLLMLSQIHWREGQLEPLTRSVQAASSLVENQSDGSNDSIHSTAALLLLVYRSMIHVGRGLPDEAVRLLTAIPHELFDSLDDDDNALLAELLVLAGAGRLPDALRDETVVLLRMLDGTGESIPLIRRFRDRHFGPLRLAEAPAIPGRDALRSRLRAHTTGLLEVLHHVGPQAAQQPELLPTSG